MEERPDWPAAGFTDTWSDGTGLRRRREAAVEKDRPVPTANLIRLASDDESGNVVVRVGPLQTHLVGTRRPLSIEGDA